LPSRDVPAGGGDAAGAADPRALAAGVAGRQGDAAAAAGADGGVLVPVQDGHHYVPKGPHRAVGEGRGNEGRHLHRAAAGVLLHEPRDAARGAEFCRLRR
jgi:hypothetical protein